MTDEIQGRPGALRENFGWPPFTVLDFAHAEWQARKKAWIGLGLRGEVGRGENLIGFSDQIKSGQYGKASNGKRPGTVMNPGVEKMMTYNKPKLKGRLNGGSQGRTYDTSQSFWAKELEDEGGSYMNDTSIFDPVLTELIYTWFAPDNGVILDPFAGGPTRAVIATKLGLEYHGHELRPEQVQANNHTAKEILGLEEADRVQWYQGNSDETLDQWEDADSEDGFDLVMTCPPYFNLEVYSDEPGDISNMDDYEAFLEIYRSILHKAAAKLKDDRFFAIVVGNVRGKARGGAYYPLVSDTIRIMSIAGLSFYNEAVLKKPNGSAQFRARRQFTAGRKLVTCHEMMLVFCKGDPKKATEACGDINRFSPDELAEDWV